MDDQSNPPSQTVPVENESAEVFSVSQDKDGKWHFSRRDFLLLGLAAGGTLLLKGICPRFNANSASAQPPRAGLAPSTGAYLYTEPKTDSKIVAALQQNDFVLLESDRPSLGWVEVSTKDGLHGWLDRRLVDFSRAFTGSSQGLNPSSTQTPTPDLTPKTAISPKQPGGKIIRQENSFAPAQGLSCGEVIQNGDFEAGQVSWDEYGDYVIVTNTWGDPYQGSWVAWMGGYNNADDLLTQLFHLPADVDNVQTLNFYLKVTTNETSVTSPYDKLILRILDGYGSAISYDIPLADSTTPMDWSHKAVHLSGISYFADQDIQIQFEATTNVSNITDFVIDLVSMNLTCGGAVSPTPTETLVESPTETPTETQTGTATLTLKATTSATASGTPTLTATSSLTPTPAAYVYLPIILLNLPTPTPIPSSTPTTTTTPCVCDSYPCVCNFNPCSCNSLPGGATPTTCTCNLNPCSCNIGPYHSPTPCFCDLNPCHCNIGPYQTPTTCYCNLAPCTCNLNPCSCNIAPCSCNLAPCTCNLNPCSCNTAPCSCNIAPCTCNTLPCSCNAFPCTCNLNPCSCNIAPCSCNISPCICNYNICTCNTRPCAVT